MGASLRLHRAPGLWFDVPSAPGCCETCRTRPAELGRYCDRLCALFDAALDALTDAHRSAPDEPRAPGVVAARTRLRAVAAVYDARRVRGGPDDDPMTRTAAADWAADVADGLLLPVAFGRAIERVTAELA